MVLRYSAVGVLALATLPMHYGYYGFVRFGIFLVFMILADREARKSRWETIMVWIGVAYNPFYPLTMSKSAWVLLNFATIVIVLTREWSQRNENK